MDNQNNNPNFLSTTDNNNKKEGADAFGALKKMSNNQPNNIQSASVNKRTSANNQAVSGKAQKNAKQQPTLSKPVVLQESEEKNNILTKLQAWWQKLRTSSQKQKISSQTNLVKDRAVVFINWQHYLILLFNSLLIALIILGMVYGYLLLLGEQKKQQIKDNAQKLEELNRQINGVEKDMQEVFTFQEKIKLVKTLINKHIYWTSFFAFLEKNTLPNVYYSSFSGNINGHYKLDAQTDSFTSIANQLLILKQNPYVIEAKTNGGDISYAQVVSSEQEGQTESIMPAVSQSTVSFDLELIIKPDIFFE